jgi:hypothetical protein
LSARLCDETLSAVRLVVMRLASGELLPVFEIRVALAAYRQRWTIETMFGNLDQRLRAGGHALTDRTNCAPCSLMAFAVALTVKTSVAMARLRPIRQKTWPPAWSLFALGLNTLRKIFVAATPIK